MVHGPQIARRDLIAGLTRNGYRFFKWRGKETEVFTHHDRDPVNIPNKDPLSDLFVMQVLGVTGLSWNDVFPPDGE